MIARSYVGYAADLIFVNSRILVYIHPEVWEQETYLDGKFFLKTNISENQLPTAEVVRSHKQLQQVERAFRELKDFLRYGPSSTTPTLG
jgi:hypothetical protein